MSPNSGYSESELMQMQQDAIRRVQEMQARAQQTLEQTWSSSQAPPEPEPEPDFAPPEPAQAPALPAPVQSQGQPGPGQNPFAGTPLAGLGNLSGLFQGRTSSPVSGLMQWAGGERGILLGLLALLMGEGADPTLLLALFYLVMFDDGESSTPDT